MQMVFSPPRSSEKSDVLTIEQFASMYAAAEFAARFGLSLDSHVVINWTALGLDHDLGKHFGAFTKNLREFMSQRRWPAAWIYAHERSAKTGLHTHVAINLPLYYAQDRIDCMQWLRLWPLRYVERRVPGAIRLRVPKKPDSFLHWLLFHYLVKGYDRDAVVQSARYAPGGRAIMLGDLIAFHWRDPGVVSTRKRAGFSQSIGPSEQALGVPFASTYNRAVPKMLRLTSDSHPTALPIQPEPPFRSTFADGIFDVRALYGQEFCRRVSGEGAVGA